MTVDASASESFTLAVSATPGNSYAHVCRHRIHTGFLVPSGICNRSCQNNVHEWRWSVVTVSW
jgi:hypothetical protein